MRRLIVPALVVLGLLTACSSTPQSGPSQTSVAHTYAVIGDSITALGSLNIAEREVPKISWINQIDTRKFRLRGGYALGGATTQWVVDHAKPVRVDVAIYLIGTNDVVLGMPTNEAMEHIKNISQIVKGRKVLLCAIPPLEPHFEQSREFNAALKKTAQAEGWAYLDPWGSLEVDGHYAPGVSGDGIHPNAAGQEKLGLSISRAIELLLAVQSP